MGKEFLLFVCFLSMLSFTVAQNTDLEDELRRVYESDQRYRVKLIDFLKNDQIDSVAHYTELMKIADLENQKIVFDILEKQGWPEGLSQRANKAIFFVIDHAEINDQKKYLSYLKKQSEAGIIDKDKYPIVLDRILVSEQKRQIYGTQTKMIIKDDAKVVYIYPVEDYKNIDSLRSTVGLLPLELYMKILESALNSKVLYDDNLSLQNTH